MEDTEKKSLTTYLELGILQDNPFAVLDIEGVGHLMATANFWTRREKKEIGIGCKLAAAQAVVEAMNASRTEAVTAS